MYSLKTAVRGVDAGSEITLYMNQSRSQATPQLMWLRNEAGGRFGLGMRLVGGVAWEGG